MVKNEKLVSDLNYYYKAYEINTNAIIKTKQVIQTLPGIEISPEFDSGLKGEKGLAGMETVKGRLSRAMEKELQNWPIYEGWLNHVPGIGPALAAGLILKYYYKYVAVCQKCGKDLVEFACESCGAVKGDGVLRFRLDFRDFPTISKWWAFMGRHTVDGVMPKRKKGVTSNWSTPGRTLGYHIGDQFNRQDDDDHPYKAFLLLRKEKHARNHPDWSRGHVHNAAKNETIKLFLAHFWTIARTIEGLPVSEPYVGAIMGHTNIIKPPYW